MPILFGRFLLGMAVSGVLYSQAQAQAPAQVGAVEVYVIDWHGRRLPAYSLTITGGNAASAGRSELKGPGPNAVNLRYGKYKVRALASLHDPTTVDFNVETERSLLVVSLPPTKWGESVDRYSELAGKVSGRLSESVKLTVRIVSLFGAFSKDDYVRSDGSFEISAVPDGEYLLLILDDFKIRGEVRVSKTPQLREVTVVLSR